MKDKRYTIAREFTGQVKPQYVVRFCGDWVTSRSTYPAAVMAATGHRCQREGALTITEKKP
jgi:hypothetical protein